VEVTDNPDEICKSPWQL